MPAKSPRVIVTVSHEQRRLLRELARLQVRPVASYLREMLDVATPMLAAVLPVYRAAAAQEAIRPEALQLAIREAIAGVEAKRDQLDLLSLLAGQSDTVGNDLADRSSAARSGATEGADRPAKRPRKRA